MRDEYLLDRISRLRKSLDQKKTTQYSGASNQIINLVQTGDSFDVYVEIPAYTTKLVRLTFDFIYNNSNYAYAQGFYGEPTETRIREALGVDITIATKTIRFMDYVILDNLTPDKITYDFKAHVLSSTTGILDNFNWESVTP